MSVKLFEPMAMISSLTIAPSPMDRGNGLETRPGIEPSGRGDVIPNLLALGKSPLFRAGRRSECSPCPSLLCVCSNHFLIPGLIETC